MRINKYTTKINRNTLRNELVKEKAVNYSSYKKLDTPARCVQMLNDLFDLENLSEEYMYMITLNAHTDISGVFEIAHGTVSLCPAGPREILNKALLIGATGIILVHNHPSGDVTPSETDIAMTKKLIEACKLIDIELLDHIIIGYHDFYSFCLNDLP